jgi:hypothetical protein
MRFTPLASVRWLASSQVVALTLVAACVGATQVVYHPDVVSLVDSDSDKAIQIVSDDRLAPHEPRAVSESAVAAGLLASGMFLEDDARVLAGPISKHMSTMEPDEALRIVAWAADAPRYYYVIVHNGKLQITYYAGSTRSEDFSAVIPTEATPIVAPVEPKHPVEPVVTPPPPPDAGVDLVAKAPPAPAKKRHHVAPAGYEAITEAEARRRMKELDEAVAAGLITQNEHKTKRKEILARL